jgi:hypothetical protein
MHSDHVFARLTGLGQTIVPQSRYRIARVDDDDRRLEVSAGDDAKAADLQIETGAATYALAEGTLTLAEVCTITTGPTTEAWRIESTHFDVQWPRGTMLTYSELKSSPFDLLGEEGVVAYLQGPFPRERLLSPAQLGAPGQKLVAQGLTGGHSWAEFSYEFEGEPWRQRQCAILAGEGTGFLLTTQAPTAALSEATAIHECLATTFRLAALRLESNPPKV